MGGVTNKIGIARHETFHLRDGWLYKGLTALAKDPMSLSEPGAHHSLGLGINMLKSMVYWLQAAGLVTVSREERNGPARYDLTDLALQIVESDPYLEDPGTLWLLHIGLATNQQLSTFWYWAFNHFNQREFTEERLELGFSEYLAGLGITGVADSSLKKDARCFLRTYLPRQNRALRASVEDTLDCPLATLDLIRPTALGDRYRFFFGAHRSLNIWLFAYALLDFKEKERSEAVTISMEELRWVPGSPGRILCLDATALADYVEALEREGLGIHLVRTAGLNQVSVGGVPPASEVLEQCFERVGGSYATAR
jgi:hypothetical protein